MEMSAEVVLGFITYIICKVKQHNSDSLKSSNKRIILIRGIVISQI